MRAPQRYGKTGEATLASFEVSRFRAFSHLQIERFGRVNLIVGRNNVGKTVLLEALRLYEARGHIGVLRSLLGEREEWTFARDEETLASDRLRADFRLRVESFFHRRSITTQAGQNIRLGPVSMPAQALELSLKRIARGHEDAALRAFKIVEDKEQSDDGDPTYGLLVSFGSEPLRLIPLSDFASESMTRRRPLAPPRSAYLPAGGLTTAEIGRWWDEAVLQGAEDHVTECIQIIAPVDRIILVEHPSQFDGRIVFVRLAGERHPVPLKSLGDGTVRLFQLALALQAAVRGNLGAFDGGNESPVGVNQTGDRPTRPKMLLVDEIENGIHYTALPQLWRFVFEAARRFGVQVFATTHSWDCIEGFHPDYSPRA